MLNPLWQSTETYISYNDVVDKWGISSAACVRCGEDRGSDKKSAAFVISSVFPDVKMEQIIKDLHHAEKSALERLNTPKEKI